MSDDFSKWDGTQNLEFMEYQKLHWAELQAKLAQDQNHQKMLDLWREYDSILSSVYRIVCFQNGRVYIGVTAHFNARKSQHLSTLRKGKHNCKIQPDFDKYGEQSFYFEVIETDVPIKQRESAEAKWMDHYRSYIDGYNIAYTYGDNQHSMAYPLRPNYLGDLRYKYPTP